MYLVWKRTNVIMIINNNNNTRDTCLWCCHHDTSHCESSPGLSDECRPAPDINIFCCTGTFMDIGLEADQPNCAPSVPPRKRQNDMEEHCKKHWLPECVDIVFIARALSQVKTRQVKSFLRGSIIKEIDSNLFQQRTYMLEHH